MGHLDAGHLLEHLAGKMDKAARPGQAENALAGILFGVSDESAIVLASTEGWTPITTGTSVISAGSRKSLTGS